METDALARRHSEPRLRRREHTTPRRAPPQAWILDTNGPPDISCSAGCFQGRALNVLPDAARRSIAHALAGLNLDPVVRLRIIAALAPILLDPASKAKPNGVAPPPRPSPPGKPPRPGRLKDPRASHSRFPLSATARFSLPAARWPSISHRSSGRAPPPARCSTPFDNDPLPRESCFRLRFPPF